MKSGKNIPLVFFALGTILALLGGGLFLLLDSVDHLVKKGIERYGSAAAGTPVRVGSVKLSLKEAQGTIGGLTVANPSGFSKESVFSFGEIFLKLDSAALTEELVVIDEIRFGSPRFRFEINAQGQTNLRILKRNLDRVARNKPREVQPSRNGQPRLWLRKLVISQAVADIDLTAVGGKYLNAALRDITLTDLGGPAGMAPVHLADALFAALVKELELEAARQGLEQATKGKFGPVSERLQKKIEEKLGGASGAALKNLIGN